MTDHAVHVPDVVMADATAAAPMAMATATATSADFAAWVAPHVRSMSYLAARLAGAADRDDVVQESLLRAWRRWSTYNTERGTPRAWLLAIVADRARRAQRTQLRLGSRQRPERQTVVAAPGDAGVDLDRAIHKLSRRQRLAIELHYFAGLSVEEAAAAMGCSEGTVKSTLFDARRGLRQVLEER